MDIANLILDYLQVLVWPALLVFALLLYRGSIGDWLEEFRRRGGEITAFGITAKLREVREEVREDVVHLREQANSANINVDELRKSVKETVRKVSREEFSALASGFYGTTASVRHEVAEEIAQMATLLELDEVLKFARDGEAGERVGAAIALGVHMRSSPKAREDQKVHSALRVLLKHPRSRVRYRAAEVLRMLPDLAGAFEDELSKLASKDTNSSVREMARRALRGAAR